MDTSETLAAILAEMREAGRSDEHADGPLIEDYADRIEAAAKRLSDAKYCEGWDNCEVTIKAEQKQSTPGNAAAMRVALEELVYRKCLVSGSCSKPIAEQCEHPSCGWYECRAALAAPPRNCDRFSTAEEAYAAWQKHNSLAAICDWLFAPAEGGDHA